MLNLSEHYFFYKFFFLLHSLGKHLQSRRHYLCQIEAFFIKLKIQTNTSHYKNHKGVVNSVILIFFITENYRRKLKNNEQWTKNIVWKRQENSKKSKTPTKENVFLLYLPIKITIEPVTSKKIDAEVTALLAKNSGGYITSTFRPNEINNFFMGSIAYGWKYQTNLLKIILKLRKDNLLDHLSLTQKT